MFFGVKINKTSLCLKGIIEHFGDFSEKTEHFSGKNVALRWSILERKQKYNLQKRYKNLSIDSVLSRNYQD